MSLLKVLFRVVFSRKFKRLRKLLWEVKAYGGPVVYTSRDEFLYGLAFFSYLFYTHAFLVSSNQPAAFGEAYKNISEEVFKKTYIALPVFFAFRYGSDHSQFKSTEELKTSLLKLYPTLDAEILNDLLLEWSTVSPDKLDTMLYKHFEEYGVFEKVFVEGADVERWFKDFLGQTFDYALQCAPSGN